jgi:hypothetical protein
VSGAVAALLLGATACGGDSTGEEFVAEIAAEASAHPKPPPPAAAEAAPAPAEPAPATPAAGGSPAPSGEQRAQLLPLPNTPDPNVSGQLTVRNAADGSTLELSASGLQPGGAYMAHVHTGTCAEQGGPHFQFDPAGGNMPPNEVHLELKATADGSGAGTTRTDRPLPAEARSVVLHRTLGEVKAACAELGETPAP